MTATPTQGSKLLLFGGRVFTREGLGIPYNENRKRRVWNSPPRYVGESP